VANDPVYSNDGYYSTQTPPQGAYSTSYAELRQRLLRPSARGAHLFGSTYSASDYVAPLLIGAAIGAGAYYATRPATTTDPATVRWHGGHGGHGWRR
jgi:hypothetical protein